MKDKFAPYLGQVLPGVLQMAALNPEMGVSGGNSLAKMTDVLAELNEDGESGAKVNIHTDEVEEKDVAIQMLAVFIDECGAGYAPYIEQTGPLLLGLLEYNANEDIRDSTASCLPGLCRAAKLGGAQQEPFFAMCKNFNQAIFKATQSETVPEVMASQLSAMKEIIDEAGNGLFNQEEVTTLS